MRLRGATIPLASLLPRDGGQQEGVRIGTVDRTLHAIFQGEGTALPLGEYDLTHVAALRLLITDSDTAPPGRLQLQLRARNVGGEVLGSVEVTLSAPSVSQEREAVLQFSRTIDDFRELFLVVNPVSAADAKALISIKTATFVQRGSS